MVEVVNAKVVFEEWAKRYNDRWKIRKSLRRVVFIAGPLVEGNECPTFEVMERNLNAAREAGLDLIRHDYAPLVPQLSVFMRSAFPSLIPGYTTLSQWYATGLALVSKADAVLRLPGESAASDAQTQLADSLGIPVFYNLYSLYRSVPSQ